MCRLLAYLGQPILLEDLVYAPDHSLVAQSIHAHEAKTATNGDGFGVGWYGERERPGCYREITPAWSDENLRSLCAQVRSGLFFAHVRASTGTATARANCHPFSHGRYLFMHNGQVGGHARIKRPLEALIPDELYPFRTGTTDSEALFLVALANGLEQDPVRAIAHTAREVMRLQTAAGITEPFRLAACVANGEQLWAFRWSSDEKPPTLYFQCEDGNVTVVSEPINSRRADWIEVPKYGYVSIRKGEAPQGGCLNASIQAMAA